MDISVFKWKIAEFMKRKNTCSGGFKKIWKNTFRYIHILVDYGQIINIFSLCFCNSILKSNETSSVRRRSLIFQCSDLI